MVTIEVPQGLSYVGGGLISTAVLLLWQSFGVVVALRKKAGIDYPQTFATEEQAKESKDALRFNCAQRAHQNTLESVPILLSMTLFSALLHPVAAGALCVSWSFFRVLYTSGYSSGNPKKRYSSGGGLHNLSLIGLLGLATYSTYELYLMGA